MFRYSLLVLAILYIFPVASKNWFKGLCYALPLIAFLERPDMPRGMLGITGLNPYNLLMLSICFFFLAQKKKENLAWSINGNMTFYLLFYIFLMFAAFLRMILDSDGWYEYSIYFSTHAPTISSMLIDHFLNSFKWIIPGILLAFGANTDERREWAVRAILATSIAFSVLVISKMIPALMGADDLSSRALRVLNRDLGYHRVDLSVITASGSWAFFVVYSYSKTAKARFLCLTGFLVCTLAMGLTGGRAGMYGWVAIGVLFGLIKWHKLLIFGPVLILVAITALPGLRERISEGFTEDGNHTHGRKVYAESGRDLYAITSGRVVVWPILIESIEKQPLLGYGMRAMQRNGDYYRVYQAMGKGGLAFAHPHSAYIQLFLEMGVLGGLVILTFYFKMGLKAVSTIRSSELVGAGVASGLLLAFIGVQGIAGFGSQSFYPKEGTVLMWCSIGIFLRYFFFKEDKQ